MTDWKEGIREGVAYLIDAASYGIDGDAIIARYDILVEREGKREQFHVDSVIEKRDHAERCREPSAARLEAHLVDLGYSTGDVLDCLLLPPNNDNFSFPWRNIEGAVNG